MSDTDTTVTVTYDSLDSFQLANYAIGQGDIVKYHGDEATLTITAKLSDQVADSEDPWSTEEMVEAFEDGWAAIEDAQEADPDGDLGITTYTVTTV